MTDEEKEAFKNLPEEEQQAAFDSKKEEWAAEDKLGKEIRKQKKAAKIKE